MRERVGLLLLFAFAGCGEAGTTGSPAQTSRIDSVGGVPHLTSSGEGAWSEDARLRADTAGMVDIGVAERPPEYVLGQIAGVALGEDGRVYVADAQAIEIRVDSVGVVRYAPEGTVEDTILVSVHAVDLPPMMVMALGRDRVAGVVWDDMGVPKVRVVPLIRGAGAAR